MNIDEFGTKVREAIKTVKALGWKLERGITIDRAGKCCCPLGAMALLAAAPDERIYSLTRAGALAGLSATQTTAFVTGFDSTFTFALDAYPELRKLGRIIAQENDLP